MDFRQNIPTSPIRPDSTPTGSGSSSKKENMVMKALKGPKWINVLSGVVLVGAALLIVGTALAFARSGVASHEGKYLEKDQYQAVFLNNGQVYFGKVTSLNPNSVVLKDVFYLTQNSATNATAAAASSDYTLVKLGCQQIHFPNDQMMINREQVTFWENLDAKGKVVKSIAEFKQQNKNNENCNASATETQSTNSGANATQNSTNTTNNAGTSN